MTNNLANITHKEFLDSLISGNHSHCSKLVKNYLDNNIEIKYLYEEIFKKSLYDIGELWEFNKISVATEHLSSAIVESILNELYLEIISKEKLKKTVIVSCVENEYHQIGIKMINDIFEINGWNSYFLGSNTPTNELINFAKTNQSDLLALSLTIYFNLPILEKMIEQIQNELPELKILVGGQAFLHGGENILTKYKNIVYKSNLNETELYIKTL